MFALAADAWLWSRNIFASLHPSPEHREINRAAVVCRPFFIEIKKELPKVTKMPKVTEA
jgi:hypothetical protein